MAAKRKKSAKATPPKPVSRIESRVDAYRALAERYEREPCVMRPCNLQGQARREHVRETIVEDHALRISNQSDGAKEKFEKLADNLFSFFRGTSLLFHRDMVGDDARMPTVLVLGDVHPTNFGVMPNADNAPIFGVNDFDDVSYGPFTWDLKRGTTGFMLAAEVEGGLGKKHRRRIARHFIRGYAAGIDYYAEHRTEDIQQMRPDNSPKVIRKLFEEAEKGREAWLWDRYVNESGRGFRANDELTPVSSRTKEFQGYIDSLFEGGQFGGIHRVDKLRVKDVCLRHGQGTASLGLARFYVLIEGPSRNAKDDLIVEFKRARRSALDGLVPSSEFDAGKAGGRIAHGQAVHLADGDAFYGNIEIDGQSFMTRERAPFREDVELDDLSKKSWRRYARACGKALAQAHSRSDDAGQIDYDVEPHIVEAMQPLDLFTRDILRFAEEAVYRLRRDHVLFREDLKCGAFRAALKSYR